MTATHASPTPHPSKEAAPGPDHRVHPILSLAGRVWVRWPRALIRRFPGLQGTAGDGHFLCMNPLIAVLAPIAAFVGGGVVGAGQLGYEDVYTESIPLMVAAIAIGVFSSQLGALAVLGFALGELFLADRVLGTDQAVFAIGTEQKFTSGPSATVAREWIPLLISYLLLITVVVVLPRTARLLVGSAGRLKWIPPALAWPLASGLYAVVVWVSVRTWAAAAPILVRPRFTWLGLLPSIESIEALQNDSDSLVVAGVVAALARQLLLGLTLVPSGMQRRVRWTETLGADDRPASERPERSRGRRLLSDVVTSALATLALAGVLEHTWVWVAAFTAMVSVRLLRSGVVAARLVDGWKRLMDKVPAVLRLGGLWLLARVVTDALSNGKIGSYTGVAMFVVGGVVMAFIVFPGNPTKAADPPPDPYAGPAPGPGPGSGYEPGPEQGPGPGYGPGYGPGHGPGPGYGPGPEPGPGWGSGYGPGQGFAPGAEPGPGPRSGYGSAHGPWSGPASGYGSAHGPGSGPGSGYGSAPGPGQGPAPAPGPTPHGPVPPGYPKRVQP